MRTKGTASWKILGLAVVASAGMMLSSASTANAQSRVDGRTLVDPWGGYLTKGIRGTNDSTGYNPNATVPASNIVESSKTGANCVRIYWEVNDGRGIAQLETFMKAAIKNKMFAMVCLFGNDITGQRYDKGGFQRAIDYWKNNATMFNRHKDYLLLNIANEVGAESEDFLGWNKSAITQLRNAGLNMPIVVDAPGYGRNVNVFFRDWNKNGVQDCKDLVNHDPRKSVIFSWHLYDPYNYRYGTQSQIKYWLDTAYNANICFILGEFAWYEWPYGNPNDNPNSWIEYSYAMDYANSKNIGWLAWEWYRRDGNHSMTTNGFSGNWKSYSYKGGTVYYGAAVADRIYRQSSRTSFLNQAYKS
jgi:mannan endo-1,4-beta-mannosidase